MAVLGTTILANGKGHFGPTDRNDQTGHSGPHSKLVPNIPGGPNRNGPSHLMNQPNFPDFWVEWKAPYIKCDSPGTPHPPIVTKYITLYILKHYNKKYIWRLKSEKIAHYVDIGAQRIKFL